MKLFVQTPMTRDQQKRKRKYIGQGVAIGVALGPILGVMPGNIALGIGPGIAIGLAIGPLRFRQAARLNQAKSS